MNTLITANMQVKDRAPYDGLDALEKDLHEHIHLENNILFPKAQELEDIS